MLRHMIFMLATKSIEVEREFIYSNLLMSCDEMHVEDCTRGVAPYFHSLLKQDFLLC